MIRGVFVQLFHYIILKINEIFSGIFSRLGWQYETDAGKEGKAAGRAEVYMNRIEIVTDGVR